MDAITYKQECIITNYYVGCLKKLIKALYRPPTNVYSCVSRDKTNPNGSRNCKYYKTLKVVNFFLEILPSQLYGHIDRRCVISFYIL